MSDTDPSVPSKNNVTQYFIFMLCDKNHIWKQCNWGILMVYFGQRFTCFFWSTGEMQTNSYFPVKWHDLLKMFIV